MGGTQVPEEGSQVSGGRGTQCVQGTQASGRGDPDVREGDPRVRAGIQVCREGTQAPREGTQTSGEGTQCVGR